MESCEAARQLLARIADGSAAEDAAAGSERAAREHLAGCASCRAALEEQQMVVAILRSRPALAPSPAFAARLSARLDDTPDWIGMLNWRAWTFRLAPVAAAIGLVALFTAAPAGSDASVDSASPIEEWTQAVPEPSTTVAELWQDGVSTDTILERLLIDADAGSLEQRHVR